MTRVKRGTLNTRKRKKILKYTKGFKWDRKTKERAAKEALLHAWTHQFMGRKKRKRDFRSLWQVNISIATKEAGISYSKFIGALKKNNIELDRKILADLAEHQPAVFKKIIEAVK